MTLKKVNQVGVFQKKFMKVVLGGGLVATMFTGCSKDTSTSPKTETTTEKDTQTNQADWEKGDILQNVELQKEFNNVRLSAEETEALIADQIKDPDHIEPLAIYFEQSANTDDKKLTEDVKKSKKVTGIPDPETLEKHGLTYLYLYGYSEVALGQPRNYAERTSVTNIIDSRHSQFVHPKTGITMEVYFSLLGIKIHPIEYYSKIENDWEKIVVNEMDLNTPAGYVISQTLKDELNQKEQATVYVKKK